MVRLGVVVLLCALVGCSDTSPAGRPSPTLTATESPSATPTERPGTPPPSTPKPPPAAGPVSMTIPSAGVRGLRVVAYVGTADDRPGTKIQNRGVAASPRGKAGGVGPGEIGNFI